MHSHDHFAAVSVVPVNGDTFDVELLVPLPGSAVVWKDRLQLLAANAPEAAEDPVAAEAAVQFVKNWLPQEEIRVCCERKRDAFGRLIGDLQKCDGTSLANSLIAAGLARPTA